MEEAKFVWMNGKFVPWKEAKVHFLTHALHYGTAVFEGIRCYPTPRGPAIFRLKDHIDRLFDSAHIMGFKIPYAEDELFEVCLELVRKNGLKECYLRPLVYLSYGKMGVSSIDCKVDIGIAAFKWGAYLGKKGEMKGIKAKVSSYIRHHPNSMMNDAKASGNYVNSMLAKDEALRAGYDEAIMLDTNGFVAECSAENIFMIRDGKLHTAPLATVLEGITRRSIMEIAKNCCDIPTVEEFFSRDLLYVADEVFLSGTAAEVTPIIEIDGRKIGDGKPGIYSKLIQQEFFDIVEGKNKKYSKWLTYV